MICCHRCQLNDPMKTQAPVLHSVKVQYCMLKFCWTKWNVTEEINYLFRLMRLGRLWAWTLLVHFMQHAEGTSMPWLQPTKWVTAEALTSKNATEVSAAMGKMYTFGMVRKIITDQGKEFVNEVPLKTCSLPKKHVAIFKTGKTFLDLSLLVYCHILLSF